MPVDKIKEQIEVFRDLYNISNSYGIIILSTLSVIKLLLFLNTPNLI